MTGMRMSPATPAGASAARGDGRHGGDRGTERPAGRGTIFNMSGQDADAELIRDALTTLGGSETGRSMVQSLDAADARVSILSDATFAAIGKDDAHAFYNRASNTVYVRRELMRDDPGFAAVTVAHEGQHLLDDRTDAVDAMLGPHAEALVAAGATIPEATDEILRVRTVLGETRAFLTAGAVARDLHVATPTSWPTEVARDQLDPTLRFQDVWNAVAESPYDPETTPLPVPHLDPAALPSPAHGL